MARAHSGRRILGRPKIGPQIATRDSAIRGALNADGQLWPTSPAATGRVDQWLGNARGFGRFRLRTELADNAVNDGTDIGHDYENSQIYYSRQ